MRVALISGTFPYDLCGVGLHTSYLARALSMRGIDVHVVTATRHLASESLSGINIILHQTRPFGVRATFEVRSLIERIKPDIIHMQLPVRYNQLGAIVFCLLLRFITRGIPFLLTLHEFSEGRMLSRVRGAALIASAPYVLFTNPNDLVLAIQLFPWRQSCFFHVPLGPTLPLEIENERAIGQPRDSHSIAYLGIIYPRKGLEVLLRALVQLKDELPGIRVHVLSRFIPRESYHRAIYRMAEELGILEKVVWYENLTDEEIVRQLRRCAITCLPYPGGATFRRSTLLEALTAGTAVITTKGLRTPPDLQHGHNVYLVPPGDPEALAAAIRSLVSSPDLVSVLCRGGVALAKRFSWQRIAAETETVYRELLRREKGSLL